MEAVSKQRFDAPNPLLQLPGGVGSLPMRRGHSLYYAAQGARQAREQAGLTFSSRLRRAQQAQAAQPPLALAAAAPQQQPQQQQEQQQEQQQQAAATASPSRQGQGERAAPQGSIQSHMAVSLRATSPGAWRMVPAWAAAGWLAWSASLCAGLG